MLEASFTAVSDLLCSRKNFSNLGAIDKSL